MTTINSQDDFLRALRENPEWKDAVRALILGEELLQLPMRFDAFVVEQRQVNGRVESDLSDLKAGQEGLRAGQARIETRMGRQENDMATVKAAHARWSALRGAESITFDMDIKYVKTLSEGDLIQMARNANPEIPRNELFSFRTADLVVEARDESGTVYIAMEASYTADLRDSGRALRNARLLTEFTGQPAIAAVASVRNVNEVTELVDSGDVYWYQIPERYMESD